MARTSPRISWTAWTVFRNATPIARLFRQDLDATRFTVITMADGSESPEMPLARAREFAESLCLFESDDEFEDRRQFNGGHRFEGVRVFERRLPRVNTRASD